jgi:hypothetical protein
MRINDGGPAFPVPTEHDHFSGMTLRDYFAAHVMCGLCACPDVRGSRELLAEEAYRFADEMLKAQSTVR